MAVKMERDNTGSCKNFASSSVNNDSGAEGESNQCLNSRELLGLEPVSLMTKKSSLRWFGHVERKDDND